MDETIDLSTVPDDLTKLAGITLTPRQQFTYRPLPSDLAATAAMQSSNRVYTLGEAIELLQGR